MPRLKSKFLFLFFFLILSFSLSAQRSRHDVKLLASNDFIKPQYEKQHRRFLLTQSRNVIIRYNPVSLTFGAAMYFYQNALSRQLSASCLYSPSCSEFSKNLITRYGLVKGILLTSDRLLRCNRIAVMDIHYGEFDDHDHKVHESPQIYQFLP